MSDPTPNRDADDARADDGPPTDAVSDEVKADAASSAEDSGAASDAPSSEELTPRPADDTESATARVDEPTD